MFAVTTCAIIPLARRHCPPASPPQTLAELTQRLARSEPWLYVVTVPSFGPENGVYLCVRPQPWKQLALLRRTADYAGHWRGVVYCERAGRFGKVTDEVL